MGPPATAVDVGPMQFYLASGGLVRQYEGSRSQLHFVDAATVWLTTEVVYASADWFIGAFVFQYTLPSTAVVRSLCRCSYL